MGTVLVPIVILKQILKSQPYLWSRSFCSLVCWTVLGIHFLTELEFLFTAKQKYVTVMSFCG